MDQSSFAKGRQTQGNRKKADALPTKAAEEAQRHLKAKLERAVERQKHSGSLHGLAVLQADVEFARTVGDYEFTSVGIRTLSDSGTEGVGIKGWNGIEPGRRWFQEQGGR